MVVKEAIAVAHYIDATGHLPGNYITKIDAKRAGWTGGSVEQIIPGKKQEVITILIVITGYRWEHIMNATLGIRSKTADRAGQFILQAVVII